MGKIIDDNAIEIYAQAVASGKPHVDAYLLSHPKCKVRGKVLTVMAAKFHKRPQVKARLEAIKAETGDKWSGFREELLGYLTADIRHCYEVNKTLSPVMKQVEQVSKMLGFDKNTLEVKAVSGALDTESASAKINFLIASIKG